MNTADYIGIVGWVGVAFCTIGFLLLNTNSLKFDSWIYQSINVIGGIGLVTSAIYFRDMPNITSNSMWVLIALYGLFKAAMKRVQAK